MSQEFAHALTEAKGVFRAKWAEMIEQRGFGFDVAKIDGEVRRRHMGLWENLLKALRTDRDEEYLQALNKEGRLQARASSRLEAVINQTSELMNLMWSILSATPAVEANPALLKPLTQKINRLRLRAENAIMSGYVDEQRQMQAEMAAESAEARRLRLEQTSLPELIKSISSFKLTRYKQGQTIFQPGDQRSALYFLMTGRVRIYELLPDGRAITLSILSINDAFAQFTKQSGYFRDIYAESMKDSIVACIQESSLEALMEDSPMLASRIMYSFSQQLSQSQALIQGLLGRDASLRLANILLKLATEFGISHPCGSVAIDLGLTHQELADMIGSNRVTVTRKLLELQDRKLISIEKHTITLTNRKALEQLVA